MRLIYFSFFGKNAKTTFPVKRSASPSISRRSTSFSSLGKSADFPCVEFCSSNLFQGKESSGLAPL